MSAVPPKADSRLCVHIQGHTSPDPRYFVNELYWPPDHTRRIADPAPPEPSVPAASPIPKPPSGRDPFLAAIELDRCLAVEPAASRANNVPVLRFDPTPRLSRLSVL